MARYPGVSIDMALNDRTVDLIGEGFDIAVRIGHLADSTLIARRITPIRFALCAAPAYLERHGVPRRPADLVRHNCLEFSYRQTGSEWHFHRAGWNQGICPSRWATQSEQSAGLAYGGAQWRWDRV